MVGGVWALIFSAPSSHKDKIILWFSCVLAVAFSKNLHWKNSNKKCNAGFSTLHLGGRTALFGEYGKKVTAILAIIARRVMCALPME